MNILFVLLGSYFDADNLPVNGLLSWGLMFWSSWNYSITNMVYNYGGVKIQSKLIGTCDSRSWFLPYISIYHNPPLSNSWFLNKYFQHPKIHPKFFSSSAVFGVTQFFQHFPIYINYVDAPFQCKILCISYKDSSSVWPLSTTSVKQSSTKPTFSQLKLISVAVCSPPPSRVSEQSVRGCAKSGGWWRFDFNS